MKIMIPWESDEFELEENEVEFQELCIKLKKHAFASPWKIFFKSVDEYNTEIEELIIDDAEVMNSTEIPQLLNDKSSIEENLMPNKEHNVSFTSAEKRKVYKIKEVLMSAQDNSPLDCIQDLDFFLMMPSYQIPVFFQMLDVPNLSEAAIILLINIFLDFKDRISIATATAFVHYVISPKIFEMKKSSSRSLLTFVVKFSEIYPKAIVDKVIIPCLKEKSSDGLPSEIIVQIAKMNLPNEYVSYCIKNILEYSIPEENTFTVLQCLVERKVHLEDTAYELLLQRLLSWSSIHNNNIKFTKLLTSILSTYGTELSDQQIFLCAEVVKSNKTIIKKAAENLLKKIEQGNI